MDPGQIARRYIAALSAGDVDAAVACVADDFHNEHTSTLGSTSHGADTYRGRLPGFLGQFGGLHYEVIDTIAEGTTAAGKVSVRYRLTAHVDGHAIDIPGVMLFDIRDGAIARRTDVWDSLTFLRQIGAVDEVGRPR